MPILPMRSSKRRDRTLDRCFGFGARLLGDLIHIDEELPGRGGELFGFQVFWPRCLAGCGVSAISDEHQLHGPEIRWRPWLLS